MQRTETIETPLGMIRYSIYTCDNCGKASTSSTGWIPLAEFFLPNYNWLLQNGNGWQEESTWAKLACSVRCWRPLMAEACNAFAIYFENHDKIYLGILGAK
jgi:hypothetical protein